MNNLISAIIIAILCTGCHCGIEAYPFGIVLNGTIEQCRDSIKIKHYSPDWEGSEIYRLRCAKGAGQSDSLLDRTPQFGAMVLDHYLDAPVKFIAPISLNLPISTMVDTYCTIFENNGIVNSLNCINFFNDFKDVSSAVRTYVTLFDSRYGKYRKLESIVPACGQDFSNLQLFSEGAFLWKSHGLTVELFVGRHHLLREEPNQDLEPMLRYEVVTRFSY